MNDYRRRFESELLDAFDREVPARPKRGWSVTVDRRVAVLAALLLLGAGTAVAALLGWTPTLGTTRFDEPAPSISRGMPPVQQLEVLGVLRREQTQADRQLAGREALKFLTGATSSEVRVEYVRALNGAGATLIPTGVLRSRGGRPLQLDALCVFYPTGDTGGTRGCWSTADLLTGRAFAEGAGHVFGLVPDSVAEVQLEFADGSRRRGQVHDNFFEVRAAGTDRGGGQPVKITWLDATGFAIGPPLR